MPQPSRSYSVGGDLMEQVIAALDTAGGCMSLVAEDRKPVDLEECRLEIGAAYDALCAVVDERRARGTEDA